VDQEVAHWDGLAWSWAAQERALRQLLGPDIDVGPWNRAVEVRQAFGWHFLDDVPPGLVVVRLRGAPLDVNDSRLFRNRGGPLTWRTPHADSVDYRMITETSLNTGPSQ
jgi:hypothetical protein